VACYDGFGNMREGRLLWASNFVPWHGGVDVLFYYPGDHNWWLGTVDSNQLAWNLAGNTAGFGALDDGRPFWIGDFTGTGGSDVLFYYPGDDNWWLGTFSGTSLFWQLVGNTVGFGHAINDGRPFWIGDFTGTGGSDVLFYYPGDDNWWVGTLSGGNLQWSLAGNTAGFGHAINDGRPFWIGDFNGDGHDEVLFYYPGDDNWWLGTFSGTSLSWQLVGNTVGFGHAINDGRPFWTGYFSSLTNEQILFYYPGDQNWWLGTISGGSLTWQLVGNTSGFGQVADGRPIWIDDFDANALDDVLFYYPGDHNWWLGSITGGNLQWTLVGNTTGFGTIWPVCAFWTGYFRGVFRADVLFYQPSDGNWWLGTLAGSNLGWTMVGNTGKPHRERLRLHVKIVSATLPANLINNSVQTMQRLYSDAGILVELVSTENLSANPAVIPLATINVGTCDGKTTTQQNTLFGNRNGVGANDVVAYFVTATTPSALNGCATHPSGRPGCVVTAIASNFTLAHEIGHVLGLVHFPRGTCVAGDCPPLAPAPTRLMTCCGTGLLTGTPVITAGEVSTMIGSGLTVPC
jgi:Metallo-peptidase family M12B Reprolysin-like